MDECMTYTIENISTNVRDVNTKYGSMKVYKLGLEGEAETVDYMISPKTPTPSIGDILEGTIGHNDFGAFFKKDKKPFTPQSPAGRVTNTDAMYVAYAKDLMIAYLNAINWDFTKLDEVAFNLMLHTVGEASKTLREFGEKS